MLVRQIDKEDTSEKVKVVSKGIQRKRCFVQQQEVSASCSAYPKAFR